MPDRAGHDYIVKPLLFLLTLFALSACSPHYIIPGPSTQAPRLEANLFVASDGERLPFRSWRTEKPLKAVVLALHGFNDYGAFIAKPAQYFNDRGISVYAYDQRGFGAGPHPGIWSSIQGMGRDLTEVSKLLRQRHPGVPLFLLGESMGGAVIMTAVTSAQPPNRDGIILSAPAVWGRSTMPHYQRFVLWLAVHTFPEVTLTGRGLNITPSDNVEMLKALGRDPYVIKGTRIDAMNGLTNLMDAALEASKKISGPMLILYGDKDEIIKKEPTKAMLENLPQIRHNKTMIRTYENGYHMLLRDLQAKIVLKDISEWVLKF
ncbi:MAG: lysophospholipase [Rhodospirillales bacterium]|nr:lysophospholipase [Rhodospirillales bacterium]